MKFKIFVIALSMALSCSSFAKAPCEAFLGEMIDFFDGIKDQNSQIGELQDMAIEALDAYRTATPAEKHESDVVCQQQLTNITLTQQAILNQL